MARGIHLLIGLYQRLQWVLLALAPPWGLLTQTALNNAVTGSDAPLTAYEITSVRVDASADDHTLWKVENSGMTMIDTPLLYVVKSAYTMSDATDDQIVGLPGWAKMERSDISGKISPKLKGLYKKQDQHQKAVMRGRCSPTDHVQ